MDREKVLEWVKKQYGTEPDYPWHDKNVVLRHKENQKWYGVVLAVGRDKLGLPDMEMVDVMNVKCDPFLIGSLRSQPGFHPAYHMNKEKWISIRLDGSVSEEKIKDFIDLSYKLTGPKKRGKGKSMGTLSKLPNIGKVVEEQLNQVGVFTEEDLKSLGAKNAWLKIQETDPSACIHRLLALEGAIRGIKKTALPEEVKEELKEFYKWHKK